MVSAVVPWGMIDDDDCMRALEAGSLRYDSCGGIRPAIDMLPMGREGPQEMCILE